jgi:hypothetical protein
MYRLVEKADVFLSNLTPAMLDGWNLSWDGCARSIRGWSTPPTPATAASAARRGPPST